MERRWASFKKSLIWLQICRFLKILLSVLIKFHFERYLPLQDLLQTSCESTTEYILYIRASLFATSTLCVCFKCACTDYKAKLALIWKKKSRTHNTKWCNFCPCKPLLCLGGGGDFQQKGPFRHQIKRKECIVFEI